MKKLLKLMLLLFFVSSSTTYGVEAMDQTKMEGIVKSIAANSEGKPGNLKFEYAQVRMLLISDVTHNRMRIIAPVAEFKNLKDEYKEAMLESNFHRSLDARYALSDGIVYSAYIHPMKELTDYQIVSAIKQVAALASSFGESYSSEELSFGDN